MSKKVAVIDECMIELSGKDADIKCGLGGDTLNTPVYIARQVNPAVLTVHYVATLGTGSFNQWMLGAQCGEDIDISLAQRMENRLPDLYYIKTDSIGECMFYYWCNEAAVKFWLESERSAAICEGLINFDYFCLNGISLAILSPTSRGKLLSLLREYYVNGEKVIFDNNHRPHLRASKEETQQAYQRMLGCTDIAFLTLDDGDALWGQQPVEDVVAHTHNAGMEEVVVKRRADSCLVSIADEGLVDIPAVKLPKKKVIDTTAVGDSFSTGYLAVRLADGIAEDAVKRGHLTVSTVIRYRDAIILREAMPAQKQHIQKAGQSVTPLSSSSTDT